MTIAKLRPSFTFTEDRLAELRAVITEAFADGKVNWETLHEALGDYLEEDAASAEHFGLFWPGKREARRLAALPSKGTLRPATGEGIAENTTRNLFIEGDNLEVLKLLQKSYASRVKMIYIDPPYNTGNDFVYQDDFSEPLDGYLKTIGAADEQGQILTTNPKASGRYHSTWLSMMHPRLVLARGLLRDDGVIFVSIDDFEMQHLRLLMNEVFGEENFIAQIVWEKGRKNDAKLFSVGHEYMVVFARSLGTLRQLKTVWREPKPGAKEIWDFYLSLRQQYETDYAAMETQLSNWYKQLPIGHPSKALSRYKHIDKYGPWRDDNISWPGGGGPTYDVIHPVTKQPCVVPERGWIFSSPETMQKKIALGLVEFREDHTKPPFRKSHIRPVAEELDDLGDVPEGDDEDDDTGQGDAETLAMQVMPSVIYKQAQVSVKYLRKLLGGKIFDNPKDHEVLARIISYCTSAGGQDIVLDFFAGSGSTGEAVIASNRSDGGNRRFVLVQLPEPTPLKSPARKAGYKTIAEIGKERMRRVIGKMCQAPAQLSTLAEQVTSEDLGFKVYKLGRSNFKAWQDYEGDDPHALQTLFDSIETPLVEGWQQADLLAEVLLLEGFPLDSRVEQASDFAANTVQYVTSDAFGHHLYVCLDETIVAATVERLGSLRPEDIFVCLDTALTVEAKQRLINVCTLRVI